jgi:hypothetical protein
LSSSLWLKNKKLDEKEEISGWMLQNETVGNSVG